MTNSWIAWTSLDLILHLAVALVLSDCFFQAVSVGSESAPAGQSSGAIQFKRFVLHDDMAACDALRLLAPADWKAEGRLETRKRRGGSSLRNGQRRRLLSRKGHTRPAQGVPELDQVKARSGPARAQAMGLPVQTAFRLQCSGRTEDEGMNHGSTLRSQ